jgi:DNA topoisomerase IB
MTTMAQRVAARRLVADGYFAVGDEILFGKYKNKRGKVVRFFDDERGVPSVEIEPVPKGRKQNKTLGLYKIWKTKEHRQKQACVIFSTKCEGNVMLGKVRDRMYDPEVCVYHLEVDGTEVCVMFDRITGFCEGINEHGLGIVNSSLMVLQDEREGVADGDNDPERSPDGIKIVKALSKRTIPEALRTLIMYKPKKFQQGLKGHTLVSDGNEVYALENTRIHTPKAIKLQPDKVHTRTNHGIYYPGAGYTKGEDYVSSIVRQWESKKQLEKVQRAEDLMPALTQGIEKTEGDMSPVRFTDKMRTTSQMVANPGKGEMLLYLVPGHSKFEGVRNLLPDGRKPKLKVRVFKYPSKGQLKDPYITVPDEMESASAKKSLRRQVMAERVAARYADKLPGGLADKKTPEDFDPEQLAKGVKIEFEHTDNRDVAREVAMDHLTEDPKYYDKLETIEKHGKSRYKSKKKVKKQDGGDMTVYEYSDRQVADRNRKKAERIEKLRKSMAKLQTKVRKDVKSKDEKVRDVALAVGLMDETFERVGNPGSAKEGHFGVTTWRVKHIKFGKGSATITYVGKSGVDQKKKITNARIVGALKRVCKDKGKDDCVLSISASDVNAYLKSFGISAKDIRGFHANTEMKAQLKKVRKGKLPADPKEKEKKLKDEFKAALEATAERVGHEASTLKSQYLVPGVEDDYMKDGTVNESHTKKGTVSLRTAAESGTPTERRILANAVNAPVLVSRTREWWVREAPALYRMARQEERPRPAVSGVHFDPNVFSMLWHEAADDAEPFGFVLQLNDDGTSTALKEGRDYDPAVVTAMVQSADLDLSDALVAAVRKKGTKSKAEKEDEKVQKMLRKEPKKKPPRYDLRDNRTLDEEDEDLEGLGGGDKGDRDLSMKWNKVGHRVAFRWLATPLGVSPVRVHLYRVAETQTAPPAGGDAGGGQQAPTFDEWVKEKRWPSKAENAPPGAEVGFEGLKKQDPAKAEQVRADFKRQFPGADDEGGKKEKGKEEPKERTREDIDADLESARNDVDELEDTIDGLQKEIQQRERNIEKLRQKARKPRVDPGARKEKIEERIGQEKEKMRQAVAQMKPLGKEIDEHEDKIEDYKLEITGQRKVIKDIKALLKNIAEDHPQREVMEKNIAEAREAIRDADGELDDHKAALTEKKKQYKELRAAGREGVKAVKFLEGKLQEAEEQPDADDPKEQLKQERKKLEEAEEELGEKKEDLKAEEARVKELKAERKDPSGAKRQREQAKKKQQKKRVQEAVQKTTSTMESMMGKGSGLSRETKAQIESRLESMSDEDLEQFALEFENSLKGLTSGDPASDDAVLVANAMSKSGYTTRGADTPEDLAERVAQIAYTRNVVANPMITGGVPVGQTEIDPQAYGERALAGYEQFKRLNGILRREAAGQIAQELRGLDPETDKAQELKAILTGMNTAQVADTGEALPGQPQPNKGNVALIRKLAETGNIAQMFAPVEDYFSTDGRQAMRNALDNMDDDEIGDFIIGDDPKHPFAQIKELLQQAGTAGSEYKQLIKSFLVDDWMNDIWGDRAVRDVMEAAGAPDWDDPEARAAISEEAKANGGPRRQEAFDAMTRIDEARAKGERPNPDDEQLVQDVLGEGAQGHREIAKSLVDTLKDKFDKWVISPATAVYKHFVETGDKSVMDTETLPHPDEASPEPRTQEQREKARAQAPSDQDRSDLIDEFVQSKLDLGMSGEYTETLRKQMEEEFSDPEKYQQWRDHFDKRKRDETAEGGGAPAGGRGEGPKAPSGQERSDLVDEFVQHNLDIGMSEEHAETLRKQMGEAFADPQTYQGWREHFDKRKKLMEADPEKFKREEQRMAKRLQRLQKAQDMRQKMREQREKIAPGARAKFDERLKKLEDAIDKTSEDIHDEVQGPGDVWKTLAGNWRAKNRQGTPKSFKDKDKAEKYSQGGSGGGDGFSGDFNIPVEDRGPTRFAQDKVAELWLARVRSLHPDDPNRPMVIVEAA